MSKMESLCFLIKKLPKTSELYYLQPGLCPSIADNFEAMNTLLQERHNHSESCITFKVSRRRQKVEIHLANERSGLAFSSTDMTFSVALLAMILD